MFSPYFLLVVKREEKLNLEAQQQYMAYSSQSSSVLSSEEHPDFSFAIQETADSHAGKKQPEEVDNVVGVETISSSIIDPIVPAAMMRRSRSDGSRPPMNIPTKGNSSKSTC